MRTAHWLAPLALMALTACGGSGTSSTPASEGPVAMGDAAAQFYASTFLMMEGSQARQGVMPTLVQGFDPGVWTLAAPAAGPCVSVSTDISGSELVLTVRFSGCAGPEGATLSGAIVFRLPAVPPLTGPVGWTIQYQNLVGTQGTRTWAFNGTRQMSVDREAKQGTLTVGSFTAAFTDTAAPSTNKTFTVTESLTANWASSGQYKLWGTFTYQAAGDTAVGGTVASGSPLLWTSSCCYPTSGILSLVKGREKADIAYGPACGAFTVTPPSGAAVAHTAPACS